MLREHWNLWAPVYIVCLLCVLLLCVAGWLRIADANEQASTGVIVGRGVTPAHTDLTTSYLPSGNGVGGFVFIPSEVPDRYWLNVRSDDGSQHWVRVAKVYFDTVPNGAYWGAAK